MKDLSFVLVFMAYVSFVYADVHRAFAGHADKESLTIADVWGTSRDTLKVVKDTTFVMNMSTNNPFNGKRHFVINLTEIPDTSYCYPLHNAKIISDYGSRRGRSHTGVDIKTHPNDSIHAVFDGVVVMSCPYYGYGNCITIRHYNGLETLYSHNSKNFVRKGDSVRAGDVIALTGRTGRATTEHLHFECRIKGYHFDPKCVFNHSTEELRHGLLKFTDKRGRVEVKLEEIEKAESL